jgi:hypothetical protein
MSDNNGWPGKPGVPLNPEKSGWHWLSCQNMPFLVFWNGEVLQDAFSGQRIKPDVLSPVYSYLGPCLTPAEVEERIATARKDAREEAALRLEELHRQHKYNPKTGDGSEHDTGYYRALVEGAGWIRALKGEDND